MISDFFGICAYANKFVCINVISHIFAIVQTTKNHVPVRLLQKN